MITKRGTYMKTCFYCKKEIPEDAALDVCDNCGRGVWGEKMFKSIRSKMERERDKGDLCLFHTEPNSSDDKDLKKAA